VPYFFAGFNGIETALESLKASIDGFTAYIGIS